MDILSYFRNAGRKDLNKNEVLHRSSEKCLSLGYVLSGRIVMKKYLSTGKELFLTEFHQGEMYGELLVLAGENYRGWLIAEEPSTVLELSSDALNELLDDPSFRHLYFQKIAERVAKMTERMEILSHNKVSDRIILYLLSHFDEGSEFEIIITELAGELNCSREALSRALSDLAGEKALVRDKGKFRISRFSELERLLSFL